MKTIDISTGHQEQINKLDLLIEIISKMIKKLRDKHDKTSY